MGAEHSIDRDRMPGYYVHNPTITNDALEILTQSLGNIFGGNLIEAHKAYSIHFSKFSQIFFSSLEAIESNTDVTVLHHFENNKEKMNAYLLQLLNILSQVPAHQLDCRRGGKWQYEARKELKMFGDLHHSAKLELFAFTGEALVQSVCKCDEMYTQWVRKVWVATYSLFLLQFVPIMLKIQKRKHIISSEYDYDLSDSALSSDGNVSPESASDFQDSDEERKSASSTNGKSSTPSIGSGVTTFTHKSLPTPLSSLMFKHARSPRPKHKKKSWTPLRKKLAHRLLKRKEDQNESFVFVDRPYGHGRDNNSGSVSQEDLSFLKRIQSPVVVPHPPKRKGSTSSTMKSTDESKESVDLERTSSNSEISVTLLHTPKFDTLPVAEQRRKKHARRKSAPVNSREWNFRRKSAAGEAHTNNVSAKDTESV